MALNSVINGPHRWEYFMFYQSYGVNGNCNDSFTPGRKWQLTDIRVHFSTAFISNQYLTLKISSILGSAYNTTLYSINASGSTDMFIHYSYPLMFLSDDYLNVVLSMKSGLNVVGFQFFGWAVAD